jgi:signal recognition particle subunit SEC65
MVSSLGFSDVDVVPFRAVDASVYEALGRRYPSGAIDQPSAEAIADAVRVMAECGLRATVVRRA